MQSELAGMVEHIRIRQDAQRAAGLQVTGPRTRTLTFSIAPNASLTAKFAKFDTLGFEVRTFSASEQHYLYRLVFLREATETRPKMRVTKSTSSFGSVRTY